MRKYYFVIGADAVNLEITVLAESEVQAVALVRAWMRENNCKVDIVEHFEPEDSPHHIAAVKATFDPRRVHVGCIFDKDPC